LLFVKPDINISTNGEYAFYVLAVNNRLEIAKWLLSIKPEINILINDQEIFNITCQKGHLDFAQWLLFVKPEINISKNNHRALRLACDKNKIDVAQWLASINPSYIITKLFCYPAGEYKIRYTIALSIDKAIDTTQIISLDTIDEHDKTCYICCASQVEIQTNCKHNFCKKCITKHNIKNKCTTCPFCRQTLNKFYNIQ